MISSIFDRLKLPYVCLILFTAGVLAYGNAIDHPFVHDDVVFIAQNPQIGNLDLKNIFAQLASPTEQSSIINTYYRPILELYYRLAYHFFGLDPHAYHLLNILLHILNGCLVFALLCQIKPDKRTFNFFVALFFVIHPIQNEAVACISGVSNLLYATVLLAGLYFYVISARRSNVLYFYISAVLFFIGLWVKEQMIVFPFLAVGLGLLLPRSEKQSKGQAAVKFAVFIGMWVLYLFVRQQLLGGSFSTGITLNGEFWLRVMTIPRTLLMYFQNMFFPFDLHYYRSIDILQNGTVGYGLFAAIILLFVWLSKNLKPQDRILYFGGMVWFVLASLPTLNITPLIIEYSLILNAEHFLYIPLIGFLIVVFVLIENYVFPVLKNVELAKILLIMVSVCNFIVITLQQNTYWRNEVALFERTVQYENIGRVYSLLGQAYVRDGCYGKALNAFEKGLTIMLAYADKTPFKEAKAFYLMFARGITLDMANTYVVLQQKDKAMVYYRNALEMDPQDVRLERFIQTYQLEGK